MTPRYLLLGSGEFMPWSAEAERFALGGRAGAVAVLATASAPEGDAVFDRWGKLAADHYAEAGCEARLIALKTRADAHEPELVDALTGVSMVFFSGGNPVYLGRTLQGTPFFDALTRLLAGGAVYAGCSAGAMVAGAHARARGPEFRRIGLGIVPQARFGVHWNRMPGFLPGLKQFIVAGGGQAFIGIDEDTAIAGDGTEWRVFGAGGVDVNTGRGRRRYRAGEEFALA